VGLKGIERAMAFSMPKTKEGVLPSFIFGSPSWTRFELSASLRKKKQKRFLTNLKS
jgi:hypothetical protein